MLARARTRHDLTYETIIRPRFPQLFSRRWRWWWKSHAPALDRLLFPVVELLPWSRWRKTVWMVRINHIACRRPLLAAIAEKREREHLVRSEKN
jgi:hypothetical protein